MARLMSNADITRVLQGYDRDISSKILLYPDLKRYNDLAELLPRANDRVIILVEDAPHRGHWTTLIRQNGNKIIYFDSYGVIFDGEFKYVDIATQRRLGEADHRLTKLLATIDPNESIVWNHRKLQRDSPQINVCGRFCCYRVICAILGYTNKQFLEHLEELSKRHHLSYDELICLLVPF